MMDLLPYRAYHFKDNCREFEFVCLNLEYVDCESGDVNFEYKIMYLNYTNILCHDIFQQPQIQIPYNYL